MTRKHERKASSINVKTEGRIKQKKEFVCATSSKDEMNRYVLEKGETDGRRRRGIITPKARPNFQPNAERIKRQPQELATYIAANQTPKCKFLKLPWHKLFRNFLSLLSFDREKMIK
jgi:hypothetical protein